MGEVLLPARVKNKYILGCVGWFRRTRFSYIDSQYPDDSARLKCRTSVLQ